MPLQSKILSGNGGNARLEEAAAGGRSIRPAPPHDDVDAVQRIQRALVALDHKLPRSFPKGESGDPDGRYGTETMNAVIAFQKKAFPKDPRQWDGRVGQLTLAEMDKRLP